MPQRATPTLLMERDIRVYLGGRLVTELGSRITREGLPLVAIIAVHATAGQLSLMAAFAYAAAIGAASLAGVLSDRGRRHPLMIAADLVRAALLASVTLAAVLGALSLLQILLVFGFVSGLSTLFDVADEAFLPDLFGRARLEGGNAAVQWASGVGETGGPALMGLLIQTLGGPIFVLLDALTYVVSAVSLGAIRRSETAIARSGQRVSLRGAAVGVRSLMVHPMLRPLAIAAAIQALGGGAFGALYEFYALRTLHLGPLLIGLLITAGGVGALPAASATRAARSSASASLCSARP